MVSTVDNQPSHYHIFNTNTFISLYFIFISLQDPGQFSSGSNYLKIFCHVNYSPTVIASRDAAKQTRSSKHILKHLFGSPSQSYLVTLAKNSWEDCQEATKHRVNIIECGIDCICEGCYWVCGPPTLYWKVPVQIQKDFEGLASPVGLVKQCSNLR